jgi:hypothetical protein
MHQTLITRFPRLGELWGRSNTASPDNYFGIYSTPKPPAGAERQFVEWESLLGMLDDESFDIFLRKAAGRVTANRPAQRGWSQLVDSINEVRGYQYARELGYGDVRLINETATPLPDIEASNGKERCLIEVKRVQESDVELASQGQVQKAQSGLPVRLQRVLRRRYRQAVGQIAGHPWAAGARKVCYLIIKLDLRTVLDRDNQGVLDDFLRDLEDGVEIQSDSRYWPAEL